MFHHFHSEGLGHPRGQGSLSAGELADLIDYVGRERILPPDEFLRRSRAGRLRPGDLCLTFDDNLRCQFDVAYPVLWELGLTAFWFVYSSVLDGTAERIELYRLFRTTHFESIEEFYARFFYSLGEGGEGYEVEHALEGFDPGRYLCGFPFYTDADRRFRFVRDEVLGPERYYRAMDALMSAVGADVAAMAANLWMGPDCLRRLRDGGHIIGLHSHTHPTRLERLPAAEQREEYATNHAILSGLLGEGPVAMSHPCNSYNAQTLEILEDLGIRVGFRANMAELSPGRVGPLELPREDHANILARMHRRHMQQAAA